METLSKLQRLKLQKNGIVRYADPIEIVYLQANDNYTLLILNDKSKFTLCRTLSFFETLFEYKFFRCHKSYLINPMYVKEIDKRRYEILLTIGEKIPFPRTKAKMLGNIMIQNSNFLKLKPMIELDF